MNRKEKRKVQDFYDEEEIRLQEAMRNMDPTSPEYKEALGVLKLTNTNREESRESRRRLAKADRGPLVKTIIGGVVFLASAAGITWFEKTGGMYTGEKRSWIDTIIRGIGNFRFFG